MRIPILLAVVLTVGLVSSGTVFGQGKKGKGPTLLDTTPADYKALEQYQGITGTVVSISPTSNSVTLRVEYQVQENAGGKNPQPGKNQQPKPIKLPNKNINNNNNQQQLIRELQQIQRLKNPAQKQQRMAKFMAKLQNAQLKQQFQDAKWVQQQMQQLAKQQQKGKNNQPGKNNAKTTTYAKEFTLPISSKVLVGKKELGIEYDDKGNIKQYSPEELKKLQHEKLANVFKAKLDEILPGHSVYVSLVKAEDKKGEKKADVDVTDIFNGKTLGGAPPANAPTVSTIVLLSDPGLGGLGTLPGKKGKK